MKNKKKEITGYFFPDYSVVASRDFVGTSYFELPLNINTSFFFSCIRLNRILDIQMLKITAFYLTDCFASYLSVSPVLVGRLI